MAALAPLRRQRSTPERRSANFGVIGMAYHLANGVYTAAFINGLAASPKASKQMQVASLALFALLLVFGLGSVIGMYTQAAVFNCPVPLD